MDNKKAWIALGIICIIWGTTYLFLKIGVHEMAPLKTYKTNAVIAFVCKGVSPDFCC